MRNRLITMILLCGGLICFVQADDRATIRAGIDAGNRQWIEAWANTDADLIASIFAPDGAMLRGGGTVARGRDEIRAVFAEVWKKNGGAVATVVTTDFWEVDDRVYETGDYTYTFNRDNVELRVGGRYLTIWKKQPDGAWRIVADLGFPDRQPQ